jgi:hypothetical protein
MFRPPFGIIWDSCLWTWLTGDSLSRPTFRSDRGHRMIGEEICSDVVRKVARCRPCLFDAFASSRDLFSSLSESGINLDFLRILHCLH